MASSVFRYSETVTVAAEQAVEGDLYGMADTVVVSGEVTEDLLSVAETITINGQVGADIAAAAGTISLDGIVGDDVRLVAGTVTVSGEVKGDLVVVARSLTVLSTAKVSGDILFFGTEADIAGQVGKSVYGTSESLRIDAVVGADVDIKTTQLTLGERADITGMVKYTSANELSRAQNARVAGKVVRNDPIVTDTATMRDVLVPLLVFLFAALVWYLLFSRLLERVVTQATVHPLRSMLTGFGLVFLTPIAVSILIMSTLGSLVGLTLLFLYFGVLIMSVTVSGVVAGAYVLKLASSTKGVSVPVVALGTVLTFLLLFVPVVGPIVLIGLILTTIGAFATHLYRTIRFS
jgi:cytoskeletal protein CcmA (bactofilin family)